MMKVAGSQNNNNPDLINLMGEIQFQLHQADDDHNNTYSRGQVIC